MFTSKNSLDLPV